MIQYVGRKRGGGGKGTISMKALRLRQIYTVSVGGGQFVSELLSFFQQVRGIRSCEPREEQYSSACLIYHTR